MNKKIPIVGGVVIIAAVIVIIFAMQSPSAELASIIASKDCNALAKFDAKYQHSTPEELGISDELFAKAVNMGVECVFDTTKDLFGG